MLVTTLVAFQTATATHSKTKARGSNMRKVDDALQAYWAGIHGAAPPQEVALLNGVFTACKDWLKRKQNKSEFQSKLIVLKSSYFNQLFLTRRTQVTNLANEALDDLFSVLTAQGILTPTLRGTYKFNKHKVATLGARQHNRMQLKTMGSDYLPERASYVQSGKTRAISGSGVHATHQYIQRAEATGQLGEVSGMSARALKSARKDVNALTVSDFEVLDAIGRTNMLSGDVNYLAKAARYQFLTFSDGAGLLRDYNDAPITAPPITAYAMDKYGNLLQKNAAPLNGAFFFNHSSFNAGTDVICAGTLTIAAGVLTSIDNNSGHYRPTRDNLHNCLDVLVQDAVDITQAYVNLYLWVGGVKQEHRYNATTFHATPNAPADIHVV